MYVDSQDQEERDMYDKERRLENRKVALEEAVLLVKASIAPGEFGSKTAKLVVDVAMEFYMFLDTCDENVTTDINNLKNSGT